MFAISAQGLTALWLAAAALFAAPVEAQTSPQQLSPEVEQRLAASLELFGLNSRLTNYAGRPVWASAEDSLLYWASPTPGEGHWVRVDAATGRRTVLIEPGELRSQLAALTGREAQLPVAIAFGNGRGADSLVFLYGDGAYSLDIPARRVSALPAHSIDALALDPANRASPRRDLIARGSGGGIEVLDGGGRRVFALRGEERYEWALPEHAWAPDGNVLLAWRIDSRRVHQLPIVEYDGALERVRYVPYPKAGTSLEVAELHAIDPRSGTMRRLNVTDAEGYAFLAGWRRGGEEALVLHLSRDGKRLDLHGASPRTGTSRLILREERPETFVGDLGFVTGDWRRQVTILPGGFLWMSERDGWRHVFRYDFSGRLLGRLTRGTFPVHEVAAVSPVSRTALVIASADPARPYDRLPYRVSMGGGRLAPLTSEPGVHSIYVSPSGRYFADGFSTRERPTAWDLVSADGRRRRYAATDAGAVFASGYRPPEAFVAPAADGTTPIHGVLFKPRDFDPGRRYPVVNYVYGGPFEIAVPQTFGGTPDSRFAASLAEAGFIVAVVDGRGTPGRGKAFQDANYGRIGQTEISDQIAAIRRAAASRPYMDLSRVGIAGYSWGGYFALRGILTGGDFYRAAYAGAPGELTELAMVNEPNMGLPSLNPEGYRLGSNLAVADQLQGALRLMHGTSDPDAPLSTTMRMADALIEAGKRFELLLIPGAGHSPAGRRRDYALRDLSLFFIRELGTPQPCDACARPAPRP